MSRLPSFEPRIRTPSEPAYTGAECCHIAAAPPILKHPRHTKADYNSSSSIIVPTLLLCPVELRLGAERLRVSSSPLQILFAPAHNAQIRRVLVCTNEGRMGVSYNLVDY